ncbi:MAG: helix-turn-helix domain-containing protein [Clostridiales bacterium]|nr:helix-turn-helix domain-containing protein [Clostridiales bacterium]
MIHVFLADRDADNVKNIRTYIKNNMPDLRVVNAIADPAKDIMALLKETQVELIIADIRFFGAAGYITLRSIHEIFPETRFILYGSYNDAEYMKRSKSFGVLETMYRPIRPADLSRCLHTAAAHFEKSDQLKIETRRAEEGYQERMYVFQDLFLKNLLFGRIRNETEIYNSFEYFNMRYNKGFTVLLLRVGHFKKILLTLSEMEKHLLSYKIALLARDSLKDYPVETTILDFNLVAALLGGVEDLDKTLSLCETLRNSISNRARIHVTIGVGRTVENAQDISISYREAESALRYRFHVGENMVIPIHFMEPSNIITYHYPFEKEARLVSTAVVGEYAYCRVLLQEIFDALRACAPLPDKLLSKLVMNILISISRYVSEQNIPIQSQFTTFFSSKGVLELDDIDEAFRYLDNSLKNFCQFIAEHHDKINADLIEAAKQYCREHYYETFSLPKIAKALNTTPEYLSGLFQKKEEKPLLEYAIRVRLDEAKRLMRETGANDDMVAVKVGYGDGRHFRGVFKQYEGVDTSDYRAQYGAFSSQVSALRYEITDALSS